MKFLLTVFVEVKRYRYGASVGPNLVVRSRVIELDPSSVNETDNVICRVAAELIREVHEEQKNSPVAGRGLRGALEQMGPEKWTVEFLSKSYTLTKL